MPLHRLMTFGQTLKVLSWGSRLVLIFICVLKGMYGRVTSCLGVREAIRPFPLCFAVWHGYKQAVHYLYKASLWSFASVSHSTFLNAPATTQVYGFPKLYQQKKKTMLILYLASDGIRPEIKRFARSGETNKFLTARHPLVSGYMLAMLAIGIQVSDWHWKHTGPGTGSNVKKVIEKCLEFLAFLRGLEDVDGKHHEYICSLVLAMVLWTRTHASIPASMFSEEPCEAMLSRLAGRLHKHTNMKIADKFSDHFACIGGRGGEEVDRK